MPLFFLLLFARQGHAERDSVVQFPERNRLDQVIDIKPSDELPSGSKMFAVWHTVTAWQAERSISIDFPRQLTHKMAQTGSICEALPLRHARQRATILFYDFVGDDLWEQGNSACADPATQAIEQSFDRQGLYVQEEWDPASWMDSLFKQSPNRIFFRDLLLPGSHDAGCYDNEVAEYSSSSIFRKENYICQSINLEQQLDKGIRALDLRFSYRPGRQKPRTRQGSGIGGILSPRPAPARLDPDEEFVIGHAPFTKAFVGSFVGLFEPLRFVLSHINSWCGRSPGEVLVLRFKSNGDSPEEIWLQFLKHVADELSENRIMPADKRVAEMTLSVLRQIGTIPGKQTCLLLLTAYDSHKKFDKKKMDGRFYDYSDLFVGKYSGSSDVEKVAQAQLAQVKKFKTASMTGNGQDVDYSAGRRDRLGSDHFMDHDDDGDFDDKFGSDHLVLPGDEE